MDTLHVAMSRDVMSVGDQSPVLAGLLAEVVAPVGQRVVEVPVPVPGAVDHVGRDEAQP